MNDEDHTLGNALKYFVIRKCVLTSTVQGDHLSGKPGNVRKFDSCQGNVREFGISQKNVGEFSGKNLVRENVT